MTGNPRSILGTLSAQDFLRDYWQQQALVIRNALPGAALLIDGDELAGLACEENAEARLVFSDKKQQDWQCEHGPFDEVRFSKLPKSHWTLLVQSVDQWLPDIHSLLEQFAFLPRWRLDDIMISYATDGGGVGPHFDYYDVFLLQASGKREWKLGQPCDDNSPLREHPQMKLLQTFDTRETHILQGGDMLYIPAGVAHWGTAIGDDCITISIGFRAASHADIVQGCAETVACSLPEHLRYRDSIAAIDNDAFRINAAAVDNLLVIWQQLDETALRRALLQALGSQATEPKAPDLIGSDDEFDAEALESLLAENDTLTVLHNPGSRFAYHLDHDRHADLFVDGERHRVSAAAAQAICHGKIDSHIVNNSDDFNTLLQLLNQGSLMLDDEHDA